MIRKGLPKNFGTFFSSRSLVSANNAKRKTSMPQKKVPSEKPVPASQLSRLTSFGGVALNVGASVLTRRIGESILGKSEESKKRKTILTKEEVSKIVDFLCNVRGAAMKVGQMISLQDDAVMDPQFRDIFEKVRNSASCMPFWQAASVIKTELGSSWRENFSFFDEKPFAAASIGQVHKAVLNDGKVVAVKMQYPGVDTSINSDLKNLSAFIRIWDILPKGLYVDNLMAVVRRELAWEVNYIREARCSQLFDANLKNSPDMDIFNIPKVIPHLSTKKVLTTEFIDGSPIDQLDDNQELRDKIGSELMKLLLKEVFVYRFMQTDPNFANFLFSPSSKKINLIDFGAARSFGKPFIDSYLKIIIAASEGDRDGVLKMSQVCGFLTGYESKSMEIAHVDSVMVLGESLRVEKFNYGQQKATRKVTSLMPVMAKERLTPPPNESYSLHRKFAGMFLLLSRLGCVVPSRKQFLEIVDNYKFDSVSYTPSNMPVDDGNTGIKL